MKTQEYPQVGLGVIIVNTDGKILVGKRKGTHVPKYAIPGGRLEMGETFEDGIKREIKEETNLDIFDPKVIAVTNNLETYKEEGKHYISVVMLVKKYSGELKNREPQKCEGYEWCDPYNLPKPHFDASAYGVSCYLKGIVYEGITNSK